MLTKLLIVGWDIAGIYMAIKNLGFNIASCLIAAFITLILGWVLIYVD
jgi:hypothetical protein